jgi:predicted ATPase
VELLERASFLAHLSDLLAQASAGHSRLVLLGGEAAAGKRVMVQEFCDG